MNKETTIAIPADPNDPEDFDVSVAGLERAHMGRRFRVLREGREDWVPTVAVEKPVDICGAGDSRAGGLRYRPAAGRAAGAGRRRWFAHRVGAGHAQCLTWNARGGGGACGRG